jgi:hypothetical protein
LEKEFQSLWDNLGDFDPYEGLNIDKCDGKIQVAENHEEESKDVKYRYFIKPRKLVDEETQKYFKPFDWKAKGVVRKRFEAVHRPRYLKKGFTLLDFKQKLQDLK